MRRGAVTQRRGGRDERDDQFLTPETLDVLTATIKVQLALLACLQRPHASDHPLMSTVGLACSTLSHTVRIYFVSYVSVQRVAQVLTLGIVTS